MKISAISNTSFQATIIRSDDMNGMGKLFGKIEDAFEKHPSDARIWALVTERDAGLFYARGVIYSQYRRLVDVEPARSDSGTTPITNVFRKILDPENKKMLNSLLGVRDDDVTTNWWKQYIAPIWNEINTTYRETTYPGTKNTVENNKILNDFFRKQIDAQDYLEANRIT